MTKNHDCSEMRLKNDQPVQLSEEDFEKRKLSEFKDGRVYKDGH